MDGACEDFNCNDTILEPNDSQTSAANLPMSTTDGMQICAGDVDWFKLQPSASNKLYMVGIDSNPSGGNLNFSVHDVFGESHTATDVSTDYYHPENPTGPMNYEMVGIIGGNNAPDHWFKVEGAAGAVNNYKLVSRQVDWQDGPNCTALFSGSDCAALTSGYHDSSKMLQFPVSHLGDMHIGEGVYFDNALSMSNFGAPVQTPSSRLWTRRELAMAVRHAIRAVQEAFPGTAALGIGDISMPDGTTPDGHPNGTHYSGANIDIAYYIRPEFHGLHGNGTDTFAARQRLRTGVASIPTHPLPTMEPASLAQRAPTLQTFRAMHMAKLAGTGRIRVIGVEPKSMLP